MAAPATPAEVAQMDRAVAVLRQQYARARIRVEESAGKWGAPPEAAQVLKAFRDVGVVLEKWASTYRAWAVAGKREDDSDYTVRRFLDFGRMDVADAVAAIASEAYDRSPFAVVVAVATATAGEVKAAVTSDTAKALVFVVGVTAVAVVLGLLLRRG